MSIDIVPTFDTLPVDVSLNLLQNEIDTTLNLLQKEIDATVNFEKAYRETVQIDVALLDKNFQSAQSDLAHAQSKLAGFQDNHSFGQFHLFERFTSSKKHDPQDSPLRNKLESEVERAKANVNNSDRARAQFLSTKASPGFQRKYVEKTLSLMDANTPFEAASYRKRIQEARDFMHDDRLGLTPDSHSPEVDRVRYSMAQGKAMVFANEAAGRVGVAIKLGQHKFIRIYSGSSEKPDMLLPWTPELSSLKGYTISCEVTKRDGSPLNESAKDVDQNEPFFDDQSKMFEKSDIARREREREKRERAPEEQSRSYAFLAYGANPEMIKAIGRDDIGYKFDDRTKRRLIEKSRRVQLSEQELSIS